MPAVRDAGDAFTIGTAAMNPILAIKLALLPVAVFGVGAGLGHVAAGASLGALLALGTVLWRLRQGPVPALEWTILAPGVLTLADPTGLIDAQTGFGPQGDRSVGGSVSRGNVARVIVAVVDAGGPQRTTIAFTDGATPISIVVGAG